MKTLRYLILTTYVALAFLTANAFASVRGDFQRTLHINGSVDLQVETGSGYISVHPGNSDSVQITGHIQASEWFGGSNAEERVKRIQNNPPILQSGNDIRIGHIDDPELRHNISISYDIVVPANTQLHSSSGSGNLEISGIEGPLEAGTGSGNIRVSTIGGGVRAHTGSGNIDADGVKGQLYAQTGSGNIHASNIAGGFDGHTGSGHLVLEQSAPGSVRAETGSGGLELRNVRGSLQAQAGSGTIKAEGEATGQWSLHTGSGSVELRFPQNASFDLTAHTGSGSINVNPPLTVQGTLGRKDIRGKVGGGGVPVEVQTGSGDIRIN